MGSRGGGWEGPTQGYPKARVNTVPLLGKALEASQIVSASGRRRWGTAGSPTKGRQATDSQSQLQSLSLSLTQQAYRTMQERRVSTKVHLRLLELSLAHPD
jgi:hypothetical protein